MVREESFYAQLRALGCWWKLSANPSVRDCPFLVDLALPILPGEPNAGLPGTAPAAGITPAAAEGPAAGQQAGSGGMVAGSGTAAAVAAAAEKQLAAGAGLVRKMRDDWAA